MYKTGYEWPDWVVPAATQGPIGRGVRTHRGEGEEKGEWGLLTCGSGVTSLSSLCPGL